MYLELEHRLTDKLAALPESGMGYQLVDLVLAGGRVVPHVRVFNGELADVPRQFANFRSDEIADVRLTLPRDRETSVEEF
jgi:hypothetical protein